MPKKEKAHEEKEPIAPESNELQELKMQLARALADYDNLRKRVEREKEEGKYLSKLVIISRLLPTFDMFTDAQRHLNDPGLGISLKVLQDTLSEEGIVEVDAKTGDAFNEDWHEAIDTTAGTAEQNGTIAEVFLKGYRFTDGPIIRHAKVKVFRS